MTPAALLDSLPVATILARGSTIAYVNRATSVMLGLPPEDMVGRAWETFLAPGEADRIRGRSDRRLRGQPEPTLYEVTAVSASGRTLPLEMHVAPLGPDEYLL